MPHLGVPRGNAPHSNKTHRNKVHSNGIHGIRMGTEVRKSARHQPRERARQVKIDNGIRNGSSAAAVTRRKTCEYVKEKGATEEVEAGRQCCFENGRRTLQLTCLRVCTVYLCSVAVVVITKSCTSSAAILRVVQKSCSRPACSDCHLACCSPVQVYPVVE